jgi:Uma2 family endonuclease
MSRPQPAKRAATYENLLAVPEPLVAEILFGELVTHPRPAPRHAHVVTRLSGLLEPPFGLGVAGPGGWVFLVEPELHLGAHIAVPDIAAWRLERLPELPDTAWIETPPDWVCEVLSPSTESYDRGDKRLICAEAGVSHVWHINPTLKMLEVYELSDGKWLLLDVVSDAAQVAAAPFAEICFSLNLLWSLGPLPSARLRRGRARPRKPALKKTSKKTKTDS